MRSHPFSRREFARRGGLAALATPLLTAATSAAQDEPKPGANDRLTLGFIGMGIQSRGHVNYFLNRKDCQVVAVCDVDTTRREAAKETVEKKYAGASKDGSYKGCAAYNDYRELLARDDIDGVVICTPDHWHAIPVLEACRAKKDIYCEKPLTLTIHEAKVLIDAARKQGVVFQTGSQQRSSEEFRKAVAYVRSGRIGKVLEVYADVGGPSRPCDLPEEATEPGLDWDRWLGPAPKRPYHSILSPRGMHKHFPLWRSYREYSGGGMTDWGAHHFDIAQWGLGRDESGPVEVIPPADERSEKGVTFVYDDGVKLIHGGPGGCCFVGEKGVILVNRGRLEAIPGKLFDEPLKEGDLEIPESPGHQANWVECIKTRQKPICDVEIGARSVTVCHLGNLAYWNRTRLKWDPKHWTFKDGAGDNAWLDVERRDPWQLPTV
jgi:predicted dehydrogenase